MIKAGVVPERIAPGKPQQNGRLERLHLTLLQDTASPPAETLREQLERLRSFQNLYNEERPHEALGNDTPAAHYAASPRRFDGVLREPSYSADQEVRCVRHNGEIRWSGETIYINKALVGEPVGLIEDDDGNWIVSYGRSRLALSPAMATVCANLDAAPVDLWTTRRRVAHRVHRSSNNSNKQT